MSPQSGPPQGPQNLPPPTEPGGVQPPAPAPPPSEPQPDPPAPSPEPPAEQPASPPPPDPPSQPATAAPAPAATPASGSGADGGDKPPESEEPKDAKEELREAIQESNEVLATASTVFPISLFPDIYTVDRTKITVSKKSLFGTNQAMSMRVEDVLNASVTAGMLFGYLQLTNRIIANDQHPYTIGPFWRSDALRLKRITQGYVIAMQKAIDVSSLSANELAHMLERLGEDDHPATNTDEPAA